MRSALALLLLLAAAAPALAAEPEGCDQFKWPIARERVLLTAPDRVALDSGATLAAAPDKAMTLHLRPLHQAGLPKPPERSQAADSFAGFVQLGAVPAGRIVVSLSAGAWIDVIQQGRYLRPAAFSGATGCEGIRKTVRFEVAAEPLTLQFSGVRADTISLTVLPSAE